MFSWQYSEIFKTKRLLSKTVKYFCYLKATWNISKSILLINYFSKASGVDSTLTRQHVQIGSDFLLTLSFQVFPFEPPETEKLCFSGIFRGIKKEHLEEKGEVGSVRN